MIDIEQPRNELISLHDQCLKSGLFSFAGEILAHVILLHDLGKSADDANRKLRDAIRYATALASVVRKSMSGTPTNNQEKE